MIKKVLFSIDKYIKFDDIVKNDKIVIYGVT
jgi:hypothetical protein